MNAITPAPSTPSANALMPRDMNSAMALANMMATSRLVPQHLQKSPGDCLMVIEQAIRWGMSPFAVAQCTSVVQGKLMFEGKLVAAALHTNGIMASRLDYEFSGDGEARVIRVRGTLRGEAKPREIEIALKDAKTSNGMWTKQPDQQLAYFATRAWARRHAPEVMLGVYSPEEFDAPQFHGTTIDSRAETPTMGQQIADELPPEGDYEFITKQGSRRMATADEWVAAWSNLIRNCKAAGALDKLEAARDINKRAIDDVEMRHPGTGAMGVLTLISDALPKSEPAKSDFPGDWPSVENAPENAA